MRRGMNRRLHGVAGCAEPVAVSTSRRFEQTPTDRGGRTRTEAPSVRRNLQSGPRCAIGLHEHNQIPVTRGHHAVLPLRHPEEGRRRGRQRSARYARDADGTLLKGAQGNFRRRSSSAATCVAGGCRQGFSGASRRVRLGHARSSMPWLTPDLIARVATMSIDEIAQMRPTGRR